MSNEKVYSDFIRDVRQHNLIVIKDEGTYRHLRFKRPSTSSYYFDLVSWPGYLCMTGDMGTWTFSRIEDMFNFFRDKDGGINPHYWSEKLEAGTGCPRDKIAYEWDEDKFRKELDERLTNWIEENQPDDDGEDSEYDDDDHEDSEYSEKLENVRDLVRQLKGSSYSEHEAYAACENSEDPEEILTDLWECNFKGYTHHYLWACYAIVWGIQQYDRKKLTDKAVSTFLACRVGASS